MVDTFRRAEQRPGRQEEALLGLDLKPLPLLLCVVFLSLLWDCVKFNHPLEEMSKGEKLGKMESYAVDVTLDPDTANAYLFLSDDGKQVHDTYREKALPYNSERFFYSAAVLGKQSFSSGRFYFEVQVEGKGEWTLGVARESINRREDITPRPAAGFWTVGLSNGNKYKAGPDVALSLQSAPKKVGVFVDYEDGLVSFYDVDTAALIYSFTGCSFTEKLYPYFSPGLENDGWNSAPLIITPVN
uniref:Nuclear factor 7, ovary-like n=1 Tax=Pundamilia nyererei TaxID=303518 RepID=A0A3B4F8N0_9CICH